MKRTKTFILFSLVFLLSGCTTINIPYYIQDKDPYREKFAAGFDKVLETTIKEIERLGWVVVSKADPSVYEYRREMPEGDGKQILLFTQVRETDFFLGSRYARMNIFVKSGSLPSTEVEIRYVTVTSIPFKTFYKYKKDKFVQRIFDGIRAGLD